jgi:hypothetical protein
MAIKKTPEQFQNELTQYNARNHPACITTTDVYVSLSTPMEFTCMQCNIGFKTNPKYVLVNNSGCPSCSTIKVSNANSVSVDEFVAQLNNRNLVHSPISYVSGFMGMTKKATFKCGTCSHKWETLPKTVVRGSGCPLCKAATNAQRQMLSSAEFNQRLDIRNEVCESSVHLAEDSTYLGNQIKIKFACAAGHSWYTRPGDIINNHAGCPHCAGTVSRDVASALAELVARWPTLTINSIHTTLLGRREQVDAQCEYGHTWTTHYERLMNGHYCPHCNGNARYDDVTFRKKLNTVNKNIEVLDHYTNATTNLTVKCTSCEHTWKPRPYNLLNGYGCPQCSKNNKFSKKAITWLRYLEKTTGAVIQHAKNYGEFRIPGTKYRCDGYDAGTNTVYEFYGDYWHGNPSNTVSTAYNTHLSKTFGDLYNTTMTRERTIRSMGFNLVSMWEADYDQFVASDFLTRVLSHLDATTLTVTSNKPTLIELQNDVVYIAVINTALPPETATRHETNQLLLRGRSLDKQTFILFSDELEIDGPLVNHKIQHYLGRNTVTKINARQCTIRQCTKQEKQQLLQANHVQGNDNAPIYYGAYYSDKLVAVMTFTAPRVALGQKGKKDRTGIWELSRFCTDVQYRIPGIASKLLTHFKRNHDWVNIYSYADKRWSTGNMYHQLGFNLIADNPPDYFYIVDGKRKHRWNYRKDILKNALPNYDAYLTEYQNMVNHGFYRLWDCGTLKFETTNTL